MKLDIFLRTHDGGDRFIVPDQEPIKRKVDATKKEITLACSYSLSESIKLCDDDISITILDDHSTKETVETLEDMFEVKVTTLEGNFEDGSLAHFTHAKNSEADLVYIIEDDFLHQVDAVQEMILSYYMFLKEVKPEVICLYPDDDYWNYMPPQGPLQTLIVPGIKRPWRMNNHTTNTMFTSPQVLRDHWEPFYTLATQCHSIPNVCEDTTINLIWKNHVPLFTPLIPLAYHLDHWPITIEFHRFGIAELWEENKL